jgi:hypothetical protein
MEPLKPDAKAKILAENPDAAPGDVEEYQRLLSQRFTIDPDFPATAAESAEAEEAEARIAQLHRKLFPQEYAQYTH